MYGDEPPRNPTLNSNSLERKESTSKSNPLMTVLFSIPNPFSLALNNTILHS